METGKDIVVSREDILSIFYGLIKENRLNDEYLHGIIDFTEILLSKFEK